MREEDELWWNTATLIFSSSICSPSPSFHIMSPRGVCPSCSPWSSGHVRFRGAGWRSRSEEVSSLIGMRMRAEVVVLIQDVGENEHPAYVTCQWEVEAGNIAVVVVDKRDLFASRC